MKKFSRSIITGMALSLIVLVGLTGSAGAAKAGQGFTVGSVAYTYESTPTTNGTYEDRLEAFNLEWTGYRPDQACVGVWNSPTRGLVASTCQDVKGKDQKWPQGLNLSGLIDNSLLSSGTAYYLRVDLVRHNQPIVFYSTSYAFTAGTDYSSPQ